MIIATFVVVAANDAEQGSCLHEEQGSCLDESNVMSQSNSALQKRMGTSVPRKPQQIALVHQQGYRQYQGVLGSLAEGESEPEAACKALLDVLAAETDADEGVDISRSLWEIVCKSSTLLPRLHKLSNGCLYVPTNRHMRSMEDVIDNPFPLSFLPMFERSFFPLQENHCPTDRPGETSSSQLDTIVKACPSGQGFIGLDEQCLEAEMIGTANPGNVKVYKVDGLIGLGESWEKDMQRSGDNDEVSSNRGRAALLHRQSAMVESNASSAQVNLTIPVKFIVCDNSKSEATERHLKQALVHLNNAFAGTERCELTLQEPIPEYPRVGIDFVWAGMSFTSHRQCNYDCMDSDNSDLTAVAPREDGKVKVVICDGSRFGSASFPGDADSQRILISNKFCIPGSTHGDDFDRAHGALVHEMGHYLGLRHTFQGGCGSTDDVDDTTPQSYAKSGCEGTQSTCGSHDNPHNFMNYGWDRCTCTFTRGQSARFWKEISMHMPDMVQLMNPLAVTFSFQSACPGDSPFTWTFRRMGTTASGRPFFKKIDSNIWVHWDPQCAGGPGYYPYWVMTNGAPSFTAIKNLDGNSCTRYAWVESENLMPPSGGWRGFCQGAWKDISVSIGSVSLLEEAESVDGLSLKPSSDESLSAPPPHAPSSVPADDPADHPKSNATKGQHRSQKSAGGFTQF